jgi:hypothetical protein
MSTTTKRLVMVVMALALVVAIPGVAAGTGDDPGTGTPGYWHKAKNWTGPHISKGVTVGGVFYTPDAATAIINMPVKGDKTLTMFPAVVAAKLNVAIGNEKSCIYESILAPADAWMAAHKPGSSVKANSSDWQNAEYLYRMLDAYNNGELCAPSRG